MATIHILDTQTANQIAAGEVVERPMSVAKELIENSVDAGATEVEVEIAEGGARYLRVTDNGHGMEKDDVELAFIRHATSKIRHVNDIFSVSSMGFRGEALASIASVARVTLTTRRATAQIGLRLVVDGGQFGPVEEVGAPVGTTVEVADLFFNTPARKKFLKSERTESGRIHSLVGKLALAHTDVAFRLINNGRAVIETPGNSSLQDTFAAVYGADLAADMLPFDETHDTMRISGLAGKPSVLKSSRNWQVMIVNQRVVENAVLVKALTNAYQSLLPKRGYPVAVIRVEIAPDRVDVNVHPQKREVKFVAEQDIFRPVYHAILGALTGADTPEAIATDIRRVPIGVQRRRDQWQADATDQVASTSANAGMVSRIADEPRNGKAEHRPAPIDEGVREIRSPHKPTANVSDQRSSYPGAGAAELQETSWLGRYDRVSAEENITDVPLFTVAPDEDLPVLPLGQIAKCFIVCQRGDDLYIIDQHAAHERVRYDRLSKETERIPTQQLLVPLLISPDPADAALLMDHQEELRQLGFTLEQAGPHVLRFTEVPADIPEEDHERMIREILLALHEYHAPNRAQLRHRALAYAACRGAIKAGHSLQMRQMRQLIVDLFATDKPFVCPHGRPVIVRFTPHDLAQLFRRT